LTDEAPAYAVAFTVAYEDGSWHLDGGAVPPYGWAVLRVGDHEIGRRELRCHRDGDRHVALEEAAAAWFRDRTLD
jgi:hypothetical protein